MGVVRETFEMQGMVLEVNSAKFMIMHFIILVQLDIINDNNFYNICMCKHVSKTLLASYKIVLYRN